MLAGPGALPCFILLGRDHHHLMVGCLVDVQGSGGQSFLF